MSSEHKLEFRAFCLNVRKQFFTVHVMEHRQRLPREAVAFFLPLEIFKSHLGASA